MLQLFAVQYQVSYLFKFFGWHLAITIEVKHLKCNFKHSRRNLTRENMRKSFHWQPVFSHIHHLICKSMIDKYQVDVDTFKGNRGSVWKKRETWKLKSKYLICKWVVCLPLTSRLLTIIKHHGCISDYSVSFSVLKIILISEDEILQQK